jgi:L-glyceraldehyde reductase
MRSGSDGVLKGKTVQGKRKLVDYPEVKEVADRLGVTTAQVLIAWGVSRGYSVIPKSVQKGKWQITE